MKNIFFPLHRKLILVISFSVLFALSIAIAAVLIYESTSFLPKSKAHLESIAHVMADMNEAALEFDDVSLATENLKILKLYTGIESATLFNKENKKFAEWKITPEAYTTDKTKAYGLVKDADHLSLTIPIAHNKNTLGQLTINLSLPPLWRRLPQYGIMFGSLALSLFVLCLVLLRANTLIVTTPIKKLADAAAQVRSEANYDIVVKKSSNDEIGQLSEEFNNMLGVINARNNDLQSIHAELESRVATRTSELEHAMTRLMESEKLAALGNIVAGVAHELNTPLGNALLVASNMRYEFKQIRDLMDGKNLRRSDLENFVDSMDNSTQLLVRSIERSAHLVQSFKSVAVNESSEALMKFNLKAIIQDVLSLLRLGLKTKSIIIDFNCSDDIELTSYPGAITQVLSNIIENAVRHGLAPKDGGEIKIAVQQVDDHVLLNVSDNGIGISAKNLKRIYEPFFTTRFGQGGSGLGLHIVHNLVTARLGGTIEAHSEEGQGCQFCIRLPLNLAQMETISQ